MIYRYRMYFLNFFYKKRYPLYFIYMNMKKIWERFIRKLLLLFNFVAKSDYYVENF